MAGCSGGSRCMPHAGATNPAEARMMYAEVTGLTLSKPETTALPLKPVSQRNVVRNKA